MPALLQSPFGAELGPAWIGLVGVAVGGLISGGVAYLLERHRAHQMYRQAVNIARSEVNDIKRVVNHALKDKEWSPGYATKNWAQSWSTYRRDLAGRLADDKFKALAALYGFTEQIQSGLASRGGAPFNEEKDEEFFRKVEDAVLKAEQKLG